MANRKVLIVAPVHEVLLQQLVLWGYEYELHDHLSQEQALALVHGYEGIITSTRLQLDKAFLDKAVHLKWIGRMGSGMEIIDTAYADLKGIHYFSSPEGNANAVAEQALGMLLSLQHRILAGHRELQQGIWQREENRGFEIEGLTAGIIGYGHNGSAFARKLKLMEVQVLAYDKYRTGYEEPGITECADLERIYAEADILSFHVPLTEETRHYFNEEWLHKMHRNFVLLNLSRGAVVRLAAVVQGFKEGRIKAAGLDVWEQEPLARMDVSVKASFDYLIGLPHFIGTPHIGGYTVEALYKMSKALVLKLSPLHTIS
jgi:D-3-phosphoglycerate dehydrogenase